MASDKIPSNEEVERALVPYVQEDFPVVVIQDGHDLITASAVLRDIVSRKKEIEELRKDTTRPLDESKKRITALFAPAIARYEQEERAIKKAIILYENAVEVERRKQEAELRDFQHHAHLEAEKLADKLIAEGNHEQAEAVLETYPVPVVLADLPKTEGVYTRSTWKAEVEDLMAFLAYCVEIDQMHFVQINQQALDALSRSTKGAIKVPGIKFVEEKIVVAHR